MEVSMGTLPGNTQKYKPRSHKITKSLLKQLSGNPEYTLKGIIKEAVNTGSTSVTVVSVSQETDIFNGEQGYPKVVTRSGLECCVPAFLKRKDFEIVSKINIALNNGYSVRIVVTEVYCIKKEVSCAKCHIVYQPPPKSGNGKKAKEEAEEEEEEEKEKDESYGMIGL